MLDYTSSQLIVPQTDPVFQMQVVGCLEGFKHFTLYLRSSEELLVTVVNNNKDTQNVATDKLELVNFDPGLWNSVLFILK